MVYGKPGPCTAVLGGRVYVPPVVGKALHLNYSVQIHPLTIGHIIFKMHLDRVSCPALHVTLEAAWGSWAFVQPADNHSERGASIRLRVIHLRPYFSS